MKQIYTKNLESQKLFDIFVGMKEVYKNYFNEDLLRNRIAELKELPPPVEGEMAIVELPVNVIFEWSDKIVADVDENNEPIEFTSGWLMKVVTPQTFVYYNEKRITIAMTMKEK